MKKIKKGKRGRREYYERKTRDDLRVCAKGMNIRGRGKMKRAELVEACIQADTGWIGRFPTAYSQRRARHA
jgi:hypothetical protein